MPILENLVNNPQMALFYVNLLRQLRSNSAQGNIDAAISADIGPITGSVFSPGTVTNLAWYFGGTSTRKILLIDGIRNSTQASALIDGYTAPDIALIPRNINSWLEGQVQNIHRVIDFSVVSRAENLDLVGYSAGGAAVPIVAAQMLTYDFRPKMKISTFGAPRTGSANFRDALSGLSVARWMMSADPIPLVPLRLQDAPQIAVVVPTRTVIQWSQFVHLQGGIAILPTNTTEAAILPPAAAASPIGSVAAWYFGIEDDPTNAHSSSTYQTALEGIVRSEAAPATTLVDDAPREHSTTTRAQEANQARQARTDAIFNQAAEQTSQPIITPEGALFKAFRSGRIWYVSFGEETVITAGPEKRARHIARAGNDFLRSLQKQAIVDPAAIENQLAIFFHLAQDPTTGFHPTINTQQPT